MYGRYGSLGYNISSRVRYVRGSAVGPASKRAFVQITEARSQHKPCYIAYIHHVISFHTLLLRQK